MALSTTLLTLATLFDAVIRGTHELTPDGLSAVGLALHRAARDAEALETAYGQAEARLAVDEVGAEDLWDAKCRGKVVVLPTHRALVAHGMAWGGPQPDRRFGEDDPGDCA